MVMTSCAVVVYRFRNSVPQFQMQKFSAQLFLSHGADVICRIAGFWSKYGAIWQVTTVTTEDITTEVF